jgi:hypothetical protein
VEAQKHGYVAGRITGRRLKPPAHTAVMQDVPTVMHTRLRRQSSGKLRAMPKLVEVFAAAILVVTMLAIIAIAMGFLPSRTG